MRPRLQVDCRNQLAHPLCSKCKRGGLMFCWCFISLKNFLLISVCRIGRALVVDERSGVIFLSINGPNRPPFSTCSSQLRMTFARAAPPAHDNKGNCCAGRRQTNYLTRWTQANQLTDQLNKIILFAHKTQICFTHDSTRAGQTRLLSSYSCPRSKI